ncbi:hypothetical protein DPEC_G00331490 [Dallia pectoralis]|uniref:Uncharacterized protein n=1 Tax=Dallia pectoralis TaxID=75939 RepID=A0ACC2F5T0_DALPE|nr:hypothetical protein DPEC_G00331490 [Dallia pectoralis]
MASIPYHLQADQTGLSNLTPSVGLSGHREVQRAGPSSALLPGGGDARGYGSGSNKRKKKSEVVETDWELKRPRVDPAQLGSQAPSEALSKGNPAPYEDPTVITVLIPLMDLQCGLCGWTLGAVGRAARHFAVQHPAMLIVYQCRRCGRTDPNHHPISCHAPKCNTTAETWMGEFVCELCGKDFPKKVGLTQHRRHKHPAVYCGLASGIDAESRNAAKVGRKPMKVRKGSGDWLAAGTSEEREYVEQMEVGGQDASGPTSEGSYPKATRDRQSLGAELAIPKELPPPKSGLERILWERLTESGTKGSILIGGKTYSLEKIRQNVPLLDTWATDMLRRVREVSGDVRPPGGGGAGRAVVAEGSRALSRRAGHRRTQKLFENDRSKLAEILFDGAGWGKAPGPSAEIALAFKSGWDVADPYLGLGQFSSDHGADNIVFLRPITPDEVKSGLRSIKNGSAAGPDGLSKKALKTWDPTGTKLAKMYSMWLALGRMPKVFKQCRTTLIPKSLDPDVRAQTTGWRPLTIGSVVTRLYSKVLNSRLTEACSISPRQRGFISSPGCSENLLILDGLISETRRRSLGLAVVFIDFARAFDSVSHSHILDALRQRSLDSHIIRVIEDSYKGVTTTVAVEGEEGPTIDMRIGVKQGDPLSPLLFNLALDPVIATLERTGSGCPLEGGKQVCTLAFADDLVLLSDSWEGMRQNMVILESFCEVTGLKVQPTKCHGFLAQSRGGVRMVNRCEPWSLGEGMIHMVGPGETVKYLGVEISPWHGVVRPEMERKLGGWVSALSRSNLKPSQKVLMFNVYAMPRLTYEADHGGAGQLALRGLDGIIRKAVKGWLHLPLCTCNGLLYSRQKDGGLGVMKLASQIPSIQARRVFRLWHSTDEVTRDVTRRAVKPAKFLRLWINAGGKGSEAPVLAGVEWPDKGETELEVDRASAHKIPTGQVLGSTKRVLTVPDWRGNEFLHWMSLDVQGLGVQVFHGDKISNHWLALPTEFGFKQRHYIASLQLRANVYPTCESLSRGRSTIAGACHYCVSGTETCPHILGQCPAVKDSRIRRHHKLCDLLTEEAESAGWHVTKEMVYRTLSGAQRRPDLVFVKDGEALVVDVTVRFEMAQDTLKMAADEKVARYTPILPQVMRSTGTTKAKVYGFPLGGRGKWYRGNDGLLKRMGVSPSRIKAVAMLFSRRVLLYSLDVLRDFTRIGDEGDHEEEIEV